ncbi:MAG: DNA polymerase III subunit delta [gamma proteobacterium symbiont of Bathyaustriella thionipta]|nr:DNA polymerase III subunit delta [gamma proteobacterium symbiont of Bathyaustriella thionipta]
MRLAPDQIKAQLQKRLLPVYLISGDEPLQLMEAADAVRHEARLQGYTSREVFDADKSFQWDQLNVAGESLSLFAERKLIDLRLSSTAIGRKGGQALQGYLENLPQDTLLLISCPNLDRRTQRNKWVLAAEHCGLLVQVWPVDSSRLQGWIQKRMRENGLQADKQAIERLAWLSEGNLMAAAQAVEKLKILSQDTAVNAEAIESVAADSAHFDVYALSENAISGRLQRALRMLQSLRSEGIASAVILWALARDLRILANLAQASRFKQSQQEIFRQNAVWEKRQPLYRQALGRAKPAQWLRYLQACAEIDQVIKGQRGGDEWLLLERLTYALGGVEPVVL